MQLQDIKQSILTMTQEESMEIHREVRRQRWIPKLIRKSSTAKKVTKSKQEIQKSPEQIKQLLMLLGADM